MIGRALVYFTTPLTAVMFPKTGAQHGAGREIAAPWN